MTRWNWVEPSFFLLFFALCFCGREEEGQVLVVVEKTTNTIVPTTTRTKGVIVCIICTIIHIHLPF